MADDPTQVPTQTSPDVLSQLAPYLALLQQGQAQPQRDMTPVEQDWRSKLGEALGGPVMMPNMTPAERQASGLMALRHFGLGMLGAVGHMQGGTIGSLLGAGFEGAERGALGAQQFDASSLAAQQEYQQKQQEMRLAAIKEALPLLSLQQQYQQAQAARDLASGKTPTATAPGSAPSIATGGSIGAPVTAQGVGAPNPLLGGLPSPPELTTVAAPGGAKFQVAATAAEKFQGLVSDLEAAGYKIDPSTSGGYNKRFIAGTQVPSEHAYGDAIDINSAKNPQGGSVSDIPPDLARSLAAKHGLVWGGDWTGKTRDPMHFELPHKTAAPGTVQTAGPGVPTGSPPAPTTDLTGPRPLPPTGPGAGVTTPSSIANTPVQTAQAQPPAVASAVAPAPQTTPTPPPSPYPDIKAGDGLIRHPGTFAEFSARESVPMPQTEDFNPNLSPAQQAYFAAKAKGIEELYAGMGTHPPAEQPKISDEVRKGRADLQAEMQAAAQEKALSAAKAQTKYNEDQGKQVQTRYDAAVNAYHTAAQSQLASAQKASESDLTSRLTSRAKVLDKLDTDAGAAQENLSQLRMVKQLSDAAGQPGVLAGYPDVRSWMVKLGIATPEQASQWSAQQALDASTQKLTLAAASGAGLGRLTDKDLDFLRKGTPQSVNPQDWRNAQMGYLMTLYDRKQKFTGLVHQGVADGMSLADAQTAADKQLGPIIKQRPVVNGAPMEKNDQARWNFDNLEPGQFYKDERGNIRIFNPGNATRPE
jgi:hypothetical protein